MPPIRASELADGMNARFWGGLSFSVPATAVDLMIIRP